MSTEQESKKENQSFFPIVVGVTGHMDLREEDIGILTGKVKSICQEIRELSPLAPLILLSPLAEGADRIAASAAMALGAQLIVPLPMPKELYEKDFITSESRREFNDLLGRASRVFELPLAEGNTIENISEYGENRDRQYAQAENFIARYSHIVIALWDGVYLKKTAGTSETVRIRMEGIAEFSSKSRNSLDLLDCGPVYHIMTPRKSNPEPQGEQFSIKRMYPVSEGQESGASAYKRIFDRIKRYNADVQKVCSSLKNEMAQSRSHLISKGKEPAIPLSCSSILDYYSGADALAVFFQRKRFTSMTGIFCSVVIAFLFLHVYIEFFHKPVVLALYPLTLFITFIIFYFANQFEYQDKHLEYRALAEALRVVFFWRLSENSLDVSDYYLKKHFNELEWLRGALKAVHIQSMNIGRQSPEPQLMENVKTVCECWVQNQCAYFTKSAQRDEKRVQQLERISDIFFWTGVVIAILTVVFHHGIEEIKLFHSSIVFLMIMVLSFAAAIKSYSEKMVLAEQVKQYARMADLFCRASKKLIGFIQRDEIQQAQALIIDLGKEALEENGDWVMFHRAKPMEVPKGG